MDSRSVHHSIHKKTKTRKAARPDPADKALERLPANYWLVLAVVATILAVSVWTAALHRSGTQLSSAAPVQPLTAEMSSSQVSTLRGGSQFTVNGSGFTHHSGLKVTVGGNPAQKLTVVNDTTLTAVAPPGKDGKADIRITSSDGSEAVLPGDFTYSSHMPYITAIAPAVGPVSGGTPVTIKGLNFEPGAEVWFGDVQGTDVKVVDSTTITLTTPAKSYTGLSDLTVYNTKANLESNETDFRFK